MQKITMFMMASCGYCRRALQYMDELYKSDARYRDIPFEMIDETIHPDIADKYDYYYVPTFYVGAKKEHEGAATPDSVKRVFDLALNS